MWDGKPVSCLIYFRINLIQSRHDASPPIIDMKETFWVIDEISRKLIKKYSTKVTHGLMEELQSLLCSLQPHES